MSTHTSNNQTPPGGNVSPNIEDTEDPFEFDDAYDVDAMFGEDL